MDYEKAFKEAYERASLRFGTNVANELFLEYKESKEERTRRKLIEFFSDWSKTKSHCWGIRVTDIMDWLEKQGSNLVENGYTNNKDIIKYAGNYSREIWHKLMDNFKNIKDYHIGCNDVSDIVLNAIIDAYNWLEKQGTFYTKRDVDDAYVEGMAFAKNELEKQKPTWSEKDEEIVTGIINDIQERLEDYPIEQLADIYFKEIKWLKSLKNRIKEE